MDPQIIISWIVSLIAGSAGGNIVGTLLKNRSLGPVVNSVLGLVGGAIGGQLLPALDVVKNVVGTDANHVATAGLSTVVGAMLPLIASFLKKPAVAA